MEDSKKERFVVFSKEELPKKIYQITSDGRILDGDDNDITNNDAAIALNLPYIMQTNPSPY